MVIWDDSSYSIHAICYVEVMSNALKLASRVGRHAGELLAAGHKTT